MAPKQVTKEEILATLGELAAPRTALGLFSLVKRKYPQVVASKKAVEDILEECVRNEELFKAGHCYCTLEAASAYLESGLEIGKKKGAQPLTPIDDTDASSTANSNQASIQQSKDDLKGVVGAATTSQSDEIQHSQEISIEMTEDVQKTAEDVQNVAEDVEKMVAEKQSPIEEGEKMEQQKDD